MNDTSRPLSISHVTNVYGSLPILIDISRLIWRCWAGRLPTGIDRTCLAYLEHYHKDALAVVQRGGATIILPQNHSQRIFDTLLEPEGNKRQVLIKAAVGALTALLPRLDIRGALYLNVGHTGLDRSGHTRWLRASGVRPVYFVHDLIPLTHPEYCRPHEPAKHELRMRTLLTCGVGVIGNSADTIAELGRHATLRGLAMPKTLIAPLGLPKFTPATKTEDSPLTGPYFVMLGTIEARKNHLLILNLWREIAERHGENTPQLVIIGQRGWECEQALDMLDRCSALKSHVIELPRCDDETLQQYLRHARALLFPSFVEGYGLPLTEALSIGTPVIASDLAVFRELGGNVPDYFNPLDGLGWLEAIMDYAQPNSSSRHEQLKRIRTYTKPNWASHFAQVNSWLDGLLPPGPMRS